MSRIPPEVLILLDLAANSEPGRLAAWVYADAVRDTDPSLAAEIEDFLCKAMPPPAGLDPAVYRPAADAAHRTLARRILDRSGSAPDFESAVAEALAEWRPVDLGEVCRALRAATGLEPTITHIGDADPAVLWVELSGVGGWILCELVSGDSLAGLDADAWSIRRRIAEIRSHLGRGRITCAACGYIVDGLPAPPACSCPDGEPDWSWSKPHWETAPGLASTSASGAWRITTAPSLSPQLRGRYFQLSARGVGHIVARTRRVSGRVLLEAWCGRQTTQRTWELFPPHRRPRRRECLECRRARAADFAAFASSTDGTPSFDIELHAPGEDGVGHLRWIGADSWALCGTAVSSRGVTRLHSSSARTLPEDTQYEVCSECLDRVDDYEEFGG